MNRGRWGAVAEQFEEMGKGMKEWITAVFSRIRSMGQGLLWTGLYFILIFSFRGSDAWFLLREGELNVLGDFLAGVFTPVAFGWLIYGYFLQRNELYLQRNELHFQREELQEARKTLGVQVKMMKEQAATDREWRQQQADRDSDRNMALGVVPRMGR